MGKAKNKSKGAKKVGDGGRGVDVSVNPDQASASGHVGLEGRNQSDREESPDHNVPPDGGGNVEVNKMSEDTRHRFQVVIPLFRSYLTLLSDLDLESARALITEGKNY